MARRSAAAASPPDSPSPAPWVDAGFRVLPIAHVTESPLNPRQRDTDVADLVASIREHGIIEPLVVRAVPDLGVYELVAGSRRLRAARHAGLREVPVLVRELSDLQVLEIALAENVHRQSMTALEEARALVRLAELDPIYRDDRVLAAKIGRSETYVRDRRKLLRLSHDVQAAVDAGALPAKHAERIARLPKDQHGAALRACFSGLLLSEHGAGGAEANAIWNQEISRARKQKLAPVEGQVDALVRAQRWDLLAPAVVSLHDLDDWVDVHATFDVTAPEVQQALRPALEAVLKDDLPGDPDDAREGGARDPDQRDEAFASATATLPRLSTRGLSRYEAEELKVIPADLWRQLEPREANCGHAGPALVVHGEAEDGSFRAGVELVTACLARTRCPRHWPPRQTGRRATTSSHALDWQVRAKKREAAAKAWTAELAALRPLVVAHARTVKLSVRLVKHALGNLEQGVLREWGVKLTDDTIAQALALYGLSTYSRDEFARGARAIGFNLAAARQHIQRAAKKTPAKKPRGAR